MKRKMSEEHKQKIKVAKRRYYDSLNGKRPYKLSRDYTGEPIVFKYDPVELIERFNDLQRKYDGKITEEIINIEFKNETKPEYDNKFF